MRRLGSTVIATALAVLVALPGLAQADDDPLFVSWTDIAPALSPGYDPDSDNLCKKGHENCVHSVIKEMERRFAPLADSCHFNAVFALTYLRTTEIYHEFWHEGQFADPNWLNHYDAWFGEYYFRAYDAYYKENKGTAPEAWQIAFAASDDKRVSGMGNVLLGMNAHINRDLPFVLYEIGLAAPDGTSRKPDHDKVNEFLNRVSGEVFPELARRFDPTVDDGNVPGTTLDDTLTFQAVPAWREQAWRNAEALANASTDLQRALVAAQIEEYAAGAARTIRDATAYGLLSPSTATDRDAYCAEHNWDS